MDLNYEIIHQVDQIGEVLNILERVPKFSLDLETTGLDYNRNEIHGVGLATHEQEWYVCLGAEKAILPQLKELLDRKDTIYFHNAGFDLHFLDRYGIRPKGIFDTQVAQWLIDENQKFALKHLAPRKLGINEELPDFKDLLMWTKRLVNRNKWEDVTIYDVPLDKLAEYACRDVRLTYDLGELSARELKQEGMEQLFFEIEMPFVYVLMDMEKTGIFIDQEKLDHTEKIFIEKRDAALHKWEKITGGLNPRSHDQVREWFYEELGYPVTRRTGKKSRPSTDKLALIRLKQIDDTGTVEALQEYKKYNKLLNTYVDTYHEIMYNSRIHGSFNQTGTVTTRLSSSDPNLQNIPSHGEDGKLIKEMMCSPIGYNFLVYDYSQIELRLLAHYSKDKTMMKIFMEGGDIHQMTADRGDISRFHAKRVNFGWIYGVGPWTLAGIIEEDSGERPDTRDTKLWLNSFAQTYPGAEDWRKRVIYYAHELGYVKTIMGHKRRLPEIHSRDQKMRSYAERQAVNSIIQGSASDVIKWAMLKIHARQSEFDANMNAQVHDELAAEACSDGAHEFGALEKEIMISAGEYFDIRVPLEVDGNVATNWYDAKG